MFDYKINIFPLITHDKWLNNLEWPQKEDKPMDISKETIELYIRESQAKIEILENDITTHLYSIERTKKEINTIKFFLEQYEKALKNLGEDDSIKRSD